MQIYQAFSGLNHQPNKEPPTIVEGIWWKQRAEHSGCFFFLFPSLRSENLMFPQVSIYKIRRTPRYLRSTSCKIEGLKWVEGLKKGQMIFSSCTPLKINMEHVLMEVWKIIFVSKWVMAVGSMLIFQGVTFFACQAMTIFFIAGGFYKLCLDFG